MAGYKWDPLFRIEPRNGRAYYVAVLTAFTDAGGHVKADVRYTPDRPERVTASRGLADARFGWRPEVDLDFQILTMSDQHALAQIADGLMSDGYNVQLSMDGGVTMREVVLSKPVAPKALAGKTFAGAAFELGVKCVELIDAIPRMGETTGNEIGAREMLPNPDFENWITSTNLAGWGEGGTSGSDTITQDTTNQYSGSSCIVMAKTNTTVLYVNCTVLGSPLPGRWYSNTVYCKAATAEAGGCRILLSNYGPSSASTSIRYWLNTTGGWSNSAVYHTNATNTTSWAQYGTTMFRVDDSFTESDYWTQQIDYGSTVGKGGNTWFDLASLRGPLLPTGVSLW